MKSATTIAPFVLLERLRVTIHSAFQRSVLYRALYGSIPDIATLDDFSLLPTVTDANLAEGNGVSDVAYMEDGQLVMELTGTVDGNALPFSAVENECDMERRYTRITKMLTSIGADPNATLIVADNETLYYAAQLERILPWPIGIVLLGDKHAVEAPDRLWNLDPACVIWASVRPVAIPRFDGRLLVTFCDQGAAATTSMTWVHHVVRNTALIPWLAISNDGSLFKTCDSLDPLAALSDTQFYLERSPLGTLVVTSFSSDEQPTAFPVIRYDTGIEVAEMQEHSFVIAPNNDRRASRI